MTYFPPPYDGVSSALSRFTTLFGMVLLRSLLRFRATEDFILPKLLDKARSEGGKEVGPRRSNHREPNFKTYL